MMKNQVMETMLDAHGVLTPAGQALAGELYDPAVGTMLTWLKEGITSEHLRYGTLSPRLDFAAQSNRDLREDLAIDTYISALPTFMRALDNGTYDPAKSSLTTYFIGACRNTMAHVAQQARYKHYTTEETREELLSWVADITYLDAESAVDTGSDRKLLHELLTRAPHNLARCLILVSLHNLGWDDAARRVGTNPSTLRSQLHRYRKKLLSLHNQKIIEIPTGTDLGDQIRATAP